MCDLDLEMGQHRELLDATPPPTHRLSLPVIIIC